MKSSAIATYELTINYSYDALSRLLSADYDNGATVYNYGYDEAGNMVNMNGTTRTYNAANQMVNDGTNTLTYDNNGNLTAVGANSYTWDRANRLLSHGGISYAYDGAGNRISQDTLKYLLDVQPGLTVVLGDSDGNHFVHAPRGIHAQEDSLGNWEYMAQDGLGSVRGIVDDVAVVQSSMSYDPYGNPFAAYGAGYLYAGEQIDSNGLSYNRARYYSPDFGTWLSLDPLETANRYVYVSGNPVNLTDASGLCPDCYAECEQYNSPVFVAGQYEHCLNGCLGENYGTPEDYYRRYMDCNGEQRLSQKYDNGAASSLVTFAIPPNSGLPQWFIDDKTRLCDELCNPESDSNVFDKLNKNICRQAANQMCDKLCNTETRSENDEVGHSGVLLRWMEYFIDAWDLRPRHIQPYKQVQGDLNDIMRNINDGWDQTTFNKCSEQRAPQEVVDFNRLAQKWRGQALPVIAGSESEIPLPGYQPEPIADWILYTGGIVLLAGAAVLVFDPVIGDEAALAALAFAIMP